MLNLSQKFSDRNKHITETRKEEQKEHYQIRPTTYTTKKRENATEIKKRKHNTNTTKTQQAKTEQHTRNKKEEKKLKCLFDM